MATSKFKGFYKLDRQQRLQKIKDHCRVDDKIPALDIQVADQMVENVVGLYQLPLGMGVNFRINDKVYAIPMVVEEPSVIAAASNGAKILGNILSHTREKVVVGQIIVEDVPNIREALERLMKNQDHLLKIAKDFSMTMVKRGGGPRNIRFEQKQNVISQYICCYLSFDPCNAMGANAINTVLEALANPIEDLTAGTVLMSILSNYSETSLTKATVSIPMEELGSDLYEGQEIAQKIQKASDYAKIDPYRAVTHNKGVMNGIDSVLMATGNDLRAISASVYAYASRLGHFQPLSTWEIQGKHLYGELIIPLPVATVGGAISVHPTSQWVLDVLGRPSAKQLAEIAAAVGLVQNFAALKALVTDGIQKGHMSMHARNLAMQVGALPEEVDQVVERLKKQQRMSSDTASEILNDIRQGK